MASNCLQKSAKLKIEIFNICTLFKAVTTYVSDPLEICLYFGDGLYRAPDLCRDPFPFLCLYLCCGLGLCPCLCDLGLCLYRFGNYLSLLFHFYGCLGRFYHFYDYLFRLYHLYDCLFLLCRSCHYLGLGLLLHSYLRNLLDIYEKKEITMYHNIAIINKEHTYREVDWHHILWRRRRLVVPNYWH